MTRKIIKYALVNKDLEYLGMQQINNDTIEVFTSNDLNSATMFESYNRAKEVGYNIKFGIGDFNYNISKDDIPTDIVKVTKTIEVKLLDKLKEIFS